MDFDEDTPAPKRRRRMKVGEEPQAAFVAGDPIETFGDASEALEAAVAHESAETDAVVEPEAPEPAAPQESAQSRDIGNWRYTPWRGRDMWSHSDGRTTTFDERVAKKFRHDAKPDQSLLKAYTDKVKRLKNT